MTVANPSVRSSRLSLKPAGERRTRVLAPTTSRYRTGHGRTRQISAAYSEIVRSLENFPDPAMFSMLHARPIVLLAICFD
jgi:hypothetical protein